MCFLHIIVHDNGDEREVTTMLIIQRSREI